MFPTLLLVLIACRSSERTHDDDAVTRGEKIGGTVVPRSHQIPPGHSAEIRKLFTNGAMSYPISVVSEKGTNTQFVQPKPVFFGTDRFVVAGPPDFNVELDRVIESIAKSPPAASSTYELSYWIVEADAATDEAVPPDLAEIRPALESLTGLGKRHFKSLDRVASRTLDGERSEVSGRIIKLEQTLSVDPDGLRLQLELELRGAWADAPNQGPHLETILQLKPDAPIILGDSALAAGSGADGNLLLYVVRAKRVD